MNATRDVLSYYFLRLNSIKNRTKSLLPRFLKMCIVITIVTIVAITKIITDVSAEEPLATNTPSTAKTPSTDTPLTQADAQKLWNRSCYSCHGDSGDIARNFLSVVDGQLEGPMHKKDNFLTFLTNHYLSNAKAKAIYSLLLTQANEKSRFEQECGSCHQTIDGFIREKLALHEGQLYSRTSKTPIFGFLQTHNDLSKKDVTFFMKKLTFKAYEIYQPIKLN